MLVVLAQVAALVLDVILVSVLILVSVVVEKCIGGMGFLVLQLAAHAAFLFLGSQHLHVFLIQRLVGTCQLAVLAVHEVEQHQQHEQEPQ